MKVLKGDISQVHNMHMETPPKTNKMKNYSLRPEIGNIYKWEKTIHGIPHNPNKVWNAIKILKINYDAKQWPYWITNK